jgi:nitrite reductase/ring-hydroxylating ferredoxin subunit
MPTKRAHPYATYQTAEPMEFAQRVERLLNFGVRNRWYVVGPSVMVGTEPVAFTRLGEELVAWRDPRGKLCVLEDFCPHRGAPLSAGRVCASGISCRYHNVEVSGDGVVVNVPAFPAANLNGKKAVKSYPVAEHFQAIFVYFGDEKHPEAPSLNLPEELLSPEWTGFLTSATWNCNYRYVLDNTIDIMHPPFLHGQSYMNADSSQQDEVVLERKENALILRRKYDLTSVDQMEVIDDNFVYERLGVFLPPAAGFGPAETQFLRIIPAVTPIDDTHCQFNVFRLRKAQGWQGAMYRFMFNTVYEQATWDLIEQDREMLEAMPTMFPPRERLYQHDHGVTALRSFFKRIAEAQLANC